jgi:hypothetical protein
MPGSIELKYGTSNQAITITITSLAVNAQQQSTAIDNTSNVFEDALVQVIVKTNSANVLATGFVNVYAYGTSDGGTTYGDGCTGTNGAVTLTSPPNLKLIGSINANVASTTYKSNPLSVAAAFNGVLPQKWGIVVENKTGTASAPLDASVGNAFYQGVLHQYT